MPAGRHPSIGSFHFEAGQCMQAAWPIWCILQGGPDRFIGKPLGGFRSSRRGLALRCLEYHKSLDSRPRGNAIIRPAGRSVPCRCCAGFPARKYVRPCNRRCAAPPAHHFAPPACAVSWDGMSEALWGVLGASASTESSWPVALAFLAASASLCWTVGIVNATPCALSYAAVCSQMAWATRFTPASIRSSGDSGLVEAA